MNPLSHVSFPTLFFVVIAKMFGINYSFFDLLILIFFSVLLDFDFFFYALLKSPDRKTHLSNLITLALFSTVPNSIASFKKTIESNKFTLPLFHHKWPSHCPLTYAPLLFLLIFNPHLKLFLICFGIFSHFILDSFFAGRVMWFYPFSKRPFVFFGGKLATYEGIEYFKNYKKMPIYKIEIIAFVVVLIKLLSLWF